jgi:uncharacterized Zn finger protein
MKNHLLLTSFEISGVLEFWDNNSIHGTHRLVARQTRIALQPPAADGSLTLEIRAPQGATVAIEATGDLNTWIESQRITGQGDTTPVKITLNPDPTVQAKFWRVRVR